ncbi:MAG: molybdopterin-dependent oxidoreductase [bacterium]
MTNTWTDIGTSDVIMIIGGNPAENHPMAFRHITNALENKYGNTGLDGNGAKLIVVDPRYTRSASKASVWNGRQMYCRLRSGTDIAFVDGMINYVIQHKKYNQPYVLSYSNAGFLLNENFKGPAETGNGRFSGFIPDLTQPVPSLGQIGKYDKSSWDYARYVPGHVNEYKALNIATDFWDGFGDCTCGTSCGFSKDTLSLDPQSPYYLGKFRQHLLAAGIITSAEVAGDPANQKTVWEHMLLHYARYDKDTVINLTGADPSGYDDVCALFAMTGEAGKAGTILYAMGTTQHTVGTQNIRAYSTLQILLGNMGVSGGGINAQRGESNVQGSTDFALLFHILPGYLGQPDATVPGDAWFDLTDPAIGEPGHPAQPASYIKRVTPFRMHQNELNWWGNFKKYIVSLMKCYWWNALGSPTAADPATAEQLQAVYTWIPKIPGNCSHIQLFEDMHAGKIKGLLAFGTNPAVGGPNSVKEREALQKLDWMVISELWENETAAFWQYGTTGQKLTSAEMAAIDTEIFLLPAAAHMEKEGFVVNSSRWAQFRYKAVEPPGDAIHEILMVNLLFDACKAAGANDYGMTFLTMGAGWYGTCDPSADILDREINGVRTNGTLVDKFPNLLDNGTTASGNWLYCGMYPTDGSNLSKRRINTQAAGMAPVYPLWTWAWPVNRRIIYNGASLEPCGWGGVTDRPWDSAHKVVWWEGSWKGDVNDGIANPHGYGGHIERSPFIMRNEGHARLHGAGMAEGPYPEHYEPLDTPLAARGENPVPSGAGHSQLINPCIKIYEPDKVGNPMNYPIIGTTYRVSEHWQAGAATRHLPWLCELFPDVIVEMSMDLALSKGINNGDRVQITTMRGYMQARALVTNRFNTFRIYGEMRHHIGVLWHWGYKGIKKGHSANRLISHVGDANTRIPESKAFLCNIEKI